MNKFLVKLSEAAYWCDECGLISPDQSHWSCAETWHDDGQGNLCTEILDDIYLPDAVRDQLATGDAGEYNPLFVEEAVTKVLAE